MGTTIVDAKARENSQEFGHLSRAYILNESTTSCNDNDDDDDGSEWVSEKERETEWSGNLTDRWMDIFYTRKTLREKKYTHKHLFKTLTRRHRHREIIR